MSPRVARYAIGCGLAQLIPLPYLDGLVERQVTRGMFHALAAERGITLPPEALDELTSDRSSLLMGCLVALLLWPVKKLFRTILYFLTVKDVVDAVAVAAHRAAMVDAALGAGVLPGRPDVVRSRMDLVLSQQRVSPIGRTLRRHPRPELPGETVSPSPLVQFVGWLQRHGGGGVVVPAFVASLSEV